MSAHVETMAYAGQTPWHGLGVPVHDGMTPQEMLQAAGLDWEVQVKPMWCEGPNGESIWIESNFAAMRSTDGKILDVVGSKWKPTQNHEAAEFLTEFVAAGGMKMHTMGSLHFGRYMWALASIERECLIGKGKGKKQDRVGGYLLISVPHILGKAMEIKFTTIRVVCWNTYSAALAGGIRRKGKVADEDGGYFKMSHSYKFDEETREQAKIAMGLATRRFDEYQEQANILAAKKCTELEAHEIFCELIEFDPATATKNKDGSIRETDFLKKLDNAFLYAPGQDFVTADHTMFGVHNAITWVCDHEYGEGAETRLKTAWFGEKAKLKEEAMALLLKRAA